MVYNCFSKILFEPSTQKCCRKTLKKIILEAINPTKPQKEPDTSASTTTPGPPSSSSTSTGSPRPTTRPPRSPPLTSPSPGEMPKNAKEEEK